MDQNKNTQGQQDQGDESQSSMDRDPAEAPQSQERGTGTEGEKNSSGISNRGISKTDEQADLPDRGSSDDSWGDQSRQSER